MNVRMLSLLTVCIVLPACTSAVDLELESDLRHQDYSLSEVDGSALPGMLSSLPGLRIWEGADGSILTVARGGLSCSANGTAEEIYLFRLGHQNSAIWEPIWVNLSVRCQTIGPGSVRFRDSRTGEVLVGDLMERFDGCPVIVKNLPSLESLRAGYVGSESEAEFPASLEFSGSQRGQFIAPSCLTM